MNRSSPIGIASKVRVLVGIITVALAVSLVSHFWWLVAASAVACTAAGLLMLGIRGAHVLDPWRQHGFSGKAAADLYWDSQAFNFGFGGLFLAPPALLGESGWSIAIVSLGIAVSLLNLMTPFCVGRLIFIYVFHRRSTDS